MNAKAFPGLPRGPAALASVVQGLLMHEHLAPSYGLELSDAQHAEAHLRSVDGMLESIAARDPAPLAKARPPAARQVGVCRHFTLLHATMLRDQGVPARARSGFGAYFAAGKYYDHWVTEYWKAAETRWVLVDAQLDAHQRALFKVDFDPLDVPRDQFLVAGEAWRRCRTGRADPADFGILGMHGLWFIASNVIRDLAALNDRVMLPWDVWGVMTASDSELDLGLIDRLAALTRTPGADPNALRTAYADPRVAVPAVVHNHIRGRAEPGDK